HRLGAHLRQRVLPCSFRSADDHRMWKAVAPQHLAHPAHSLLIAMKISEAHQRPLACAIIFIPNLGRNVTSGKGSTRCPDTNEKPHFCAMVAAINTPFIQANDSPMHCLTPPPKGK